MVKRAAERARASAHTTKLTVVFFFLNNAAKKIDVRAVGQTAI